MSQKNPNSNSLDTENETHIIDPSRGGLLGDHLLEYHHLLGSRDARGEDGK